MRRLRTHDELEAQGLGLFGREVGRRAAGDEVDEAWTTGEAADDGLGVLARAHALAKGDVGAGVEGLFEAVDGGLDAERLERVGAGDEDYVGAATLATEGGGADAGEELGLAGELLAEQVTAALLGDLGRSARSRGRRRTWSSMCSAATPTWA